MSIHVIIDGYNLIRQSHTLSELDRLDLQQGRDALVDRLAAYKRIKPHKITIVFDGPKALSFSQTRDYIKGIGIKFSRGGESADTVIKRMVQRQREKALVVSSDLDLVKVTESYGAATISSPDFEEKLAMAEYRHVKGHDDEAESGWIPTTKKKGPSRRLSKRMRRNRIKVSKL
jgi:predicted RNA-binding protein with PIN domain